MIDIEFFTYFAVLFAICSIWLFDRKEFSLIFAVTAAVLAMISENIDYIGLAVIITFFGACRFYYKPSSTNVVKVALWLIIIAAAVLLRAHLVPGFYNWRVIDSVILSDNAYEYSLWLNLDTAFVGLGILLFGLTPISRWNEILRMLVKMLPTSILGLSVTASVAMILGVVQFDGKIPDLWLLWMIINLMITCVGEEALFRFFIQQTLQDWLKNCRYGAALAIGITAIIATLTHYNLMHANYMATVLVASLFYGYVYYITKRVEASILLHFAINVSHFFFFTYPMLKIDYGL